MRIRLLAFLLIVLLPLSSLKAQNERLVDSLDLQLKKAKDPEKKFNLYQNIVSLLKPEEVDKYKKGILLNAELSNNTILQLRTYRLMAQISSPDELPKYLDKMFALAKDKKNEEFQGWYYLYNGSYQCQIKGDMSKGLAQMQEANAIAVENGLDSLAYEVNGMMGYYHAGRGERLLQYKAYMTQLSLAEKIGDGRVALSAYWQMFWFYNNLKQYTKAKEYAVKILETGKKKNWSDWTEGGNHLLTHYYTNVGDFEMAKYYYKVTKKLRQKNHSTVSEDDDLLDIYNNSKDYKNMLRLLQKDDVKRLYFRKGALFGPYNYYWQTANCYTKLGIRDSAWYYLRKMKAEMGKDKINDWGYYASIGNYFKLVNNADSAAVYYGKADSGTGFGNNFEDHIERYANLDTLFSHKGDYQKAYQYKELWMQYKDSATALSKEGDLVVLEIENENQRMEAETRASHNIQYMGITAAIASVFILLALLGVFSSSTTIIRGIGFFAFIFFFEFLILLFDNFIHELTHGEPWKVLSIKIILIAMLLPLHHYVEHKVVHHLLHRKKLKLPKWKKVTIEAPEHIEDPENTIG